MNYRPKVVRCRLKTGGKSIVSAFCRLGYRIIAEGVETQEEMELLRSWNVDMIQGYYFSRPLPPGELLRLLTEEAVEQL